MAVTVKHNWTIGSADHALEVGKTISVKTFQMRKDGKLLERTEGENGVPTFKFVDHAAADEFIEFMKQFNPESVEVNEV